MVVKIDGVFNPTQIQWKIENCGSPPSDIDEHTQLWVRCVGPMVVLLRNVIELFGFSIF